MVRSARAADKPSKKKTPERESFRGTTIPFTADVKLTMRKTRERYDLVNDVDAVRFALKRAEEAIDVRSKLRGSRYAKYVQDATVFISNRRAGRASKKEETKAQYMRLRDRDYTRIDTIRTRLADAMACKFDDVTQAEAIQFALKIESAACKDCETHLKEQAPA
jgi:hypothetical protein